MKRTKIVATVGPSSESFEMISKLIDSGVDVFRLNLKHSTPEWHSSKIELIRKVADSKNRTVGILLDLKGPEIRIGTFKNGQITLKEAQRVEITDLGKEGDDGKIFMKNMGVLSSLQKGQRFFMNDGNLEFEVSSVEKHSVWAKVIRGGILSNQKSVNFPTIELDVPVIVEKDLQYISLGIEQKVDFFALSFVRRAKDIEELRAILKKKKSDIQIVAKIERPQAVEKFDEILQASDAIMIGRGDLGVEIPLQQVPIVQKDIIKRCREAGKPVITATQMLESMINSPRPTRAEVSDVANAIMDGTDAVMLSAESASGNYPIEAVEMMRSIDAEVISKGHSLPRLPHQKPKTTTEAISQAIDTLSHNPLNFKAIVLLTETGRTARSVSKFRPVQPIYALTRSKHVANQLSLVWGVMPIISNLKGKSADEVAREAFTVLKKDKVVVKGDSVICVSGAIIGQENLTNSITIRTV